MSNGRSPKGKTEEGWKGVTGNILTYTGKAFPALEPDPDLIDIDDISHALSNLCRFAGHVTKFYSVAEHCVRCLDVAVDDGADVLTQLAVLLHDSTEAYLVDLPRPIKRADGFGGYRQAEKKLDRAVIEKFGLHGADSAAILDADLRLLVTEARDLLPVNDDKSLMWPLGIEPLPEKIEPWTPERSKKTFRARYEALEFARSRQ